VVAGLAALLADPVHDELPADEVVSDLFRRVPLGVKEDVSASSRRFQAL